MSSRLARRLVTLVTRCAQRAQLLRLTTTSTSSAACRLRLAAYILHCDASPMPRISIAPWGGAAKKGIIRSHQRNAARVDALVTRSLRPVSSATDSKLPPPRPVWVGGPTC